MVENGTKIKGFNNVGVEPKIEGKHPKMDGENFMENPMNKWMIWGVLPPLFLVQHPYKGQLESTLF